MTKYISVYVCKTILKYDSTHIVCYIVCQRKKNNNKKYFSNTKLTKTKFLNFWFKTI